MEKRTTILYQGFVEGKCRFSRGKVVGSVFLPVRSVDALSCGVIRNAVRSPWAVWRRQGGNLHDPSKNQSLALGKENQGDDGLSFAGEGEHHSS